MNDEAPPLRPLVEQLAEKAGAVALIVIVVGGVLYLLNRSSPLDIAYMGDNLGILLEAARISLLVTGGAYLAGLGLGFLFGWMRSLRVRPVRWAAALWVESFRGTPLFVQMLFLFFLLSYYNPGDLPADVRVLVTGFLALMLNTSAYQAEIFRAGLQSVAAGQVEAARSIGLGYWGAMRSVILPQAVRIVVPPLTNEFTSLLKASSLLFAIGVPELTYRGRFLSFAGGHIVEVYVLVAICYILMTVPLTKVVAWLEFRFRIPGLGFQRELSAPRRRPTWRGILARLAGSDLDMPRFFARARHARTTWTTETAERS